jgi:hypothetical protein
MAEPIVLVYWYWYALAGVLIILEILAPGIVFLWLAIGAVAAGTVLLAVPDLIWYFQAAIFAVASALSLLFGHNLLRSTGQEEAARGLNQRGVSLIGAEAALIEPIVNGTGRARLGDGSWAVTAATDLPVGTRVRVIAADGPRLTVEAI